MAGPVRQPPVERAPRTPLQALPVSRSRGIIGRRFPHHARSRGGTDPTMNNRSRTTTIRLAAPLALLLAAALPGTSFAAKPAKGKPTAAAFFSGKPDTAAFRAIEDS